MNIGEPERIHTIVPDREPVPEKEPCIPQEEPARPEREPVHADR